MQTLDESRIGNSGLGYYVDRISRRIDDWRTRNTDLRDNVVRQNVSGGNRRLARTKQRDLPQRIRIGPTIAIGIEGKHTVMLCGHKHHVVSGAGLWRSRAHGDAGHV